MRHLRNWHQELPIPLWMPYSDGELFLASENRKYFFWVSTRTGTNRFGDKSDAHWEVIECDQIHM